MKKTLLLVCTILLLAGACKKKVDTMEFSGIVVDCRECTGTGFTSMSDMDWGWVIALSKPDSVGAKYLNSEGKEYNNVVVMYGTHTLPKQNEKVSGELYFDKDYAASYCHYRNNDLPQTVCEKLN